ncbi:MAG: hypothetical protein QXV32_07755 [Conexivisphaerales archaeon]
MPKNKTPSSILAVSTTDGCLILYGPDYRKGRRHLKGESVNNLFMTKSGRFVASTLTDGVYVSDDGESWSPSSRGLNVRKVWTVEEDRHAKSLLYAGTQYGHLFKSEDEGKKWEEVTGLFNAPNRNKWGIDWGFGTTGLTVHTIKSDPFRKGRLYIVVSGNGVYRSDDNGENWRSLKKGVTASCPIASRRDAPETPQGSDDYDMSAEEHLKRVHSCTHKLAISQTKEGLLFQQNHCGIYLSEDSGNSWRDISPSDDMRHGFGIAISNSNRVFVIPAYQGICKEHLSCIKGKLKVLTTDDKGRTWKEQGKGLPEKVHTCVLRDSLAVTAGSPAEVFFGTTTGEVYYSKDEGETWEMILQNAGRIQGISAFPAS